MTDTLFDGMRLLSWGMQNIDSSRHLELLELRLGMCYVYKLMSSTTIYHCTKPPEVKAIRVGDFDHM